MAASGSTRSRVSCFTLLRFLLCMRLMMFAVVWQPFFGCHLTSYTLYSLRAYCMANLCIDLCQFCTLKCDNEGICDPLGLAGDDGVKILCGVYEEVMS